MTTARTQERAILRPMPVSLPDVERMAREISVEEDSALEVLAARHGEGAADYIEVILTLHRETAEPMQVVIGVSRNTPASEMRRFLRAQLREQLDTLS